MKANDATARDDERDWTTESPWCDHPFLQGIMRPVSEELPLDDLPDVEGKIPEVMSGVLLRNGPNQRFAPRTTNYHFFDGDGMVHGLWIDGGRARYSNRWVRTRAYEMQVAAGRSLWGGLQDSPLRSPPPRGGGPMKQHGGVNAVWHGGCLLAVDEVGLPWRLDPRTLETHGEHDFGGAWDYPFTPHPKIDPETGEMICFGYDVSQGATLRYAVVDRNGRMTHQTEIELLGPRMIHDIAITANYTVILDVPICFRKAGALVGRPFRYEAARGARLGVLPRHGDAGSLRWFDIPPCSVFHVLNAWEEGEEIVVWAPRGEDVDMSLPTLNPTAASMRGFDHDTALPDAPRITRWRLSLRTGRLEEQVVALDESLEFPRINDGFMGRRTQYGYLMRGSMDAHIKLDLQTFERQVHRHGDGHFCFEMVFVPHPEAMAEDHGWLVGYRYDLARDRSCAVIIDARDFEAPPVATIALPQRVPMGPHGTWTPKSDIPWPS